MPPLYSSTIESLYPVYTITCADTVLEYTTKKEERGGPESSMAEGSKLSDCIFKSAEKLKDTPCAEIRAAYADCIKNGRVKCLKIKAQLEECSAKHIGKMD